MMLKNKNAVVYGAGRAVGGAVARGFAREGAKVFLTGRTVASVKALADEITRAGGAVEVAQVDALDEQTIETHLGDAAESGSIDVSFNAIGIPQQGIQGIALSELPVDSFILPISSYARAHFLTARAAARRMAPKGSGVILMHTPEPGRMGAPFVGGMGPAWAALEALCRDLSWELASSGVRTVCLRSTGLPETGTIDVVFGLHAKALGIEREQFQGMMENMAHTGRSNTLAELANAAAFLASDLASGMTGTVVNLTGGKAID